LKDAEILALRQTLGTLCAENLSFRERVQDLAARTRADVTDSSGEVTNLRKKVVQLEHTIATFKTQLGTFSGQNSVLMDSPIVLSDAQIDIRNCTTNTSTTGSGKKRTREEMEPDVRTSPTDITAMEDNRRDKEFVDLKERLKQALDVIAEQDKLLHQGNDYFALI
jgi:hypothetical protein